jgi:hypothetical protein
MDYPITRIYRRVIGVLPVLVQPGCELSAVIVSKDYTGSPAAPELAISRVICMTVRQASVISPCRDMARAMCRVTEGLTILDD